jgi:hypothetical protein
MVSSDHFRDKSAKDAIVRFHLHIRLNSGGWEKDGRQKMDHSPANDPCSPFCQLLTGIPRQHRQENGGRKKASS